MLLTYMCVVVWWAVAGGSAKKAYIVTSLDHSIRKTNQMFNNFQRLLMVGGAVVAALMGAALVGAAMAHDYRNGALHVDHPWARPSFSKAVPAAVYLTLVNHGDTQDTLIKASSDIAQSTEIHQSVTDENGVARMTMAKEGIALAPHQMVSLDQGGFHIMLIGMSKALKIGDEFAMELEFAKAGKTEVIVKVEDPQSGIVSDEEHKHHGQPNMGMPKTDEKAGDHSGHHDHGAHAHH